MKLLIALFVLASPAVGQAIRQNGIPSVQSASESFTSTVTVSGTGSQCFSVDNPTLVVDCGNHRVGISTAAPVTTLDVNGSAQFGSGITRSTFSTTGALTLNSGSALTVSGANGFITSSSSLNVTGLVSAQQLGVGTLTPSTGLDVNTIATFRFGQSNVSSITVIGPDQNLARLRLFNTGGPTDWVLNAGIPALSNAAFSINDNIAGVPRLTITNSTGRVAILGATTASQATTQLSVYGGVITSSSTQATGGVLSCNAGTGVVSAACTDDHCVYLSGVGAVNCTYTFGTAWPKVPVCICGTDAATPIAVSATALTTSVKCTALAAMTGDNVSFLCMGAP